jgi:hypothetical protein
MQNHLFEEAFLVVENQSRKHLCLDNSGFQQTFIHVINNGC